MGYRKMLIFIVLLIVIFSSCQLTYHDTVTVTVTGKERVHSKDSSKYLIFTEEETFENTDYLLIGKFNSSDIYGKIKEGETYTFDVAGLRIPILSAYRNIHKVH